MLLKLLTSNPTLFLGHSRDVPETYNSMITQSLQELGYTRMPASAPLTASTFNPYPVMLDIRAYQPDGVNFTVTGPIKAKKGNGGSVRQYLIATAPSQDEYTNEDFFNEVTQYCIYISQQETELMVSRQASRGPNHKLQKQKPMVGILDHKDHKDHKDPKDHKEPQAGQKGDSPIGSTKRTTRIQGTEPQAGQKGDSPTGSQGPQAGQKGDSPSGNVTANTLPGQPEMEAEDKNNNKEVMLWQLVTE